MLMLIFLLTQAVLDAKDIQNEGNKELIELLQAWPN
jgi:hypothetical protein